MEQLKLFGRTIPTGHITKILFTEDIIHFTDTNLSNSKHFFFSYIDTLALNNVPIHFTISGGIRASRR